MGLPRPSSSNTAVVTGASSGIGVELARGLSRRGWHVTLVARRADRLESLVAELGGPDAATAVTADLSSADSRRALVEALSATPRSVGVLVNNAGVGTTGPVAAADLDAELAMVETNIAAVVHLTTAVLGEMVAAGAGGILQVASTAAFQPVPGQAAYGATKSFVLSYSEAIRAEVAKSGVTVTVLCPGPVDTEFGERAGFDREEAEGALPKVMWESPVDVAEVGLAGLERGRMVAVPGVVNRVAAAAASVIPRTALLPLMARAHPSLD